MPLPVITRLLLLLPVFINLCLVSGGTVISAYSEEFTNSSNNIKFAEEFGSGEEDTGSVSKENYTKIEIIRCCGYHNCSENDGVDFTVPVYDKTKRINASGDYFTIVTQKICSSKLVALNSTLNETWFVQSNGYLYLYPNDFEGQKYIKPLNYCLHFYKENNTTKIEANICLVPQLQEHSSTTISASSEEFTTPSNNIEFEEEFGTSDESVSEENNTKTEIIRCCGYHNLKQGCSENDSFDLTVPVYNKTKIITVSGDYFTVVTQKMCNVVIDLDPTYNETWFVQTDGYLYLHPTAFEGQKYIKPQDYCLYFYKENNTTKIQANLCITPKLQELAEQYKDRPHLTKTIGMLISMPFLLVTLLVYAFIPDLQNIHGKCLICYVVSLLTAYLFLVCVQLDTGNTASMFCLVAPFIIYFSFMVSFMWLHVMCIDIWWTFSGLRGYKGSAKQSEQKRFLLYSLYAWGVPLLMLAVALGLQFAPDDSLPDWVITPQIAVTKCWFPNDQTLGAYFYGPILLIILVNVGLFVYTTFKIWGVHRSTDQSMKHESQRHGSGTDSDKQRYKLYLKLMFVFGVNWLMEIISWWAHGPQWLWYVTDMCNALYGVFIFFIFVCKPNVWKLVRKRYHVMMGRPYLAQTFAPTSSTRSTAVTSTSGVNGTQDSFALTTSTAA